MEKHGVNNMKKVNQLFILPLLALSLFNVNNIQSNNSKLQLEETTNDANIIGIRKETTPSLNEEVKVSNILKVQASSEENGKRSLRFVAGISSLSLNAHFHRDEIKVNGEVIMKANDIEITCAYSKILNGEQEQTASEVFGSDYNYFVAYTLKDIPEDYWFTEINISLFVNQEKITYRNANVYGALDNFSDTFTYSADHKAIGLNSNVADNIENVTIPQYYYEITNDDYNLIANENNKTQIEEVGRFASNEYLNFYSTTLKKVIIPEGVKTIGIMAFASCSNLVDVELPKSIVTLSNHSFAFCSSLKNIILNSNVIVLDSAFGDYEHVSDYDLSIYFEGTEEMIKTNWNSEWKNGYKGKYYVYSSTQPTSNPTNADGYWHYVDNEPVIWEINSTEN